MPAGAAIRKTSSIDPITTRRTLRSSTSISATVGTRCERFDRRDAAERENDVAASVCLELLQALHDDEPAGSHDAHGVGDLLDLAEHVGGEEDGATTGLRLTDHRAELALHEWVEATGGFVQDQELGLVHEGLDDPELLSVAP